MDGVNCDICFENIPFQLLVEHEQNCLQEQMNLLENKKINPVELKLTQKQFEAIYFFKKKSKIYSSNVKSLLKSKVINLGYNKGIFGKLSNYFKNIKLIVHFDTKLISKFNDDDHLRNLFEVNSSKGYSSTTVRSEWENNLFNSIYNNSTPFERVKYGTINITNDKIGVSSAIGYGDSYLIMKDNIKLRTSLVFEDSSKKQIHIGSFKQFYHILYYLPDNDLKAILDAIVYNKDRIYTNFCYYIEAQIHGPIRFDRDVDLLVIDKKYKEDISIINQIDKFKIKNNINWVFNDNNSL